MARLRTLKPSFFANEELATLPFSGRLLFAGLWTIADRRGRLEDRPTRIKAQIYPYDDVATDELLDGLAQMGFIQRYDVEGLHYIQVVNFEKHQNPHLREAESTIPPPAPTKAVPSTVLSTTKAVTSPAVLRSPFSVLRVLGTWEWIRGSHQASPRRQRQTSRQTWRRRARALRAAVRPHG